MNPRITRSSLSPHLAAALVALATSAAAFSVAHAETRTGERAEAATLPSTLDLRLKLDAEFAPLEGGIADAEYGRRYYRRRVYYSDAPPQPVQQSTVQVIEVVTPPPQPQRVVVTPVYPEPTRYYERELSVALHTLAISYGDTELANGTLDGENVGGVGLAFRMGLDRHWGLEFAVDYAEGSSDEANTAVMPMTASLTARLFPDSMLDLFGLAGGGIHYTKVDYLLPTGDVTYMRWGGHVGGGAELKLDHLIVTADVRYLIMQAAPNGVPKLAEQAACAEGETCSPARPANTAARPVVKEDVTESVIDGVQFTLGAGYRW